MIGRGGGGGRGRAHSDYSPRHEERERRTGWGVAPPSRHLWVGNLSNNVTQNALREQFLRFGDIDNIAYNPGRSFAFVNFKKVDDAVIALRGLQGFNMAGMSLRIEFAKGDRASVLPQDEEQQRYNDARHSSERGESLVRRDLRPQRSSPEKSHEKSKGNRNADPSEMLWIGFPSFMNIDEQVLRRAFSPFGEIEKVLTFPGRSYAFVRFRTVASACRAKEVLQGKLFNNPRVSICFARNDTPAEQGRGSMNGPFPPHFNSNFHPGLSAQGGETFKRERSFESPIRREFQLGSPGFMSNIDQMSGLSGDANIMGFGRNNSVRTGPAPGPNFGGSFDHGRHPELGSERRLAEDANRRNSPAADRHAPWHDLPFERLQRSPLFEDSWGMEKGSFPPVKKMKTDLFPDNELPEYPFSDLGQEKRNTGFPKFLPGLHEKHAYNKSFDSAPFGYKGVPDQPRNLPRQQTESDDSLRPLDSFSAGSGPPLLDPVKFQKYNSEPPQLPANEEWKWEGTISKGGSAVCHARCFPVGKVLDFMLPEVLDCTARTGLDMLAKHYYQAASSWVVFFVPQTDADMGLYNEFMHYLGEKQRAAVAKLGEKVSLFLVPPSDFSEQVLKVPGKVSISGVILKFQVPSSSFSALNNPLETMESKPTPLLHQPNDGAGFHGDTSFTKAISPDFRPFSQSQNYFGSSSGHFDPIPSTFPQPYKPGDNCLPMEKVPDFRKENRPDQFQDQNTSLPPNWSSNTHVPNSRYGGYPPPAPIATSRSYGNPKTEEYSLVNSRVTQGMTSNSYAPEPPSMVPMPPSKSSQQQQETNPQVSSTMQLPLQPEQLAQLAALLGQQKQSGNPTSQTGANKLLNLFSNPGPQGQVPLSHPQDSMASGLPGPPVSQPQHMQQQPSTVPAVQQPVGNPAQQNSQQASNSSREDTEADPQKRLQATLQLAAALLQQIQQQAKN